MSWHRISLVAVCLFAVGGTIALAGSLSKNGSSQILAQNLESPLNLGREKGNLLEELNLTESQRQELGEIRTKYERDITQIRRSLLDERQALKDIVSGNASKTELREQYQKLQISQLELWDLHFESMLEMRDILDLQQRQKFVELMGKHHHKNHRKQGKRHFYPNRTNKPYK